MTERKDEEMNVSQETSIGNSGYILWKDRPESSRMTHEEYLNQKARMQAYEEEQKLKEEEKKTHEPFVKLKDEGMKNLIEAKLDGSALNILLFLMKEMGYDNTILISQNTIGEILGLATITVRKALKDLENKHIIKVIKSGNARVYCINASIVWRTYANRERYAQFNARVIVSEKEQEPKTDKEKKKEGTIKKGRVNHVNWVSKEQEEE